MGGELISAGGTGTYDLNTWATEIQAGSYALMDTAYGKLGLPFAQALSVLSTVISVSTRLGRGRLRPQGPRHGPRQPVGRGRRGVVLLGRAPDVRSRLSPLRVGDRIRVLPAHVDPTVAYHEHLYVVDGDEVLDRWDVDLRGW